MQTFHPRHFAIVPAAGTGSRMASELPKQYLPLLGQPLIRHSLATLCAAPEIDKVFVVLSVGDAQWARYDWSTLGPKLVPLFCGGPTRADSVLAGLRAISGEAAQSGGLLAVPVADTLKRADSQRHVAATVPRDSLWQAQTPQMFRYVMLRRALESAHHVTDEASAVEAAGLRPRLVEGDATNLKVTYPLDLHLAEWILNNREGMNR